MGDMFCFQCEQTAGCAACTGRMGVCGKTAAAAGLQDQLTGALVGMARAAKDNAAVTDGTVDLAVDGLFATVTNVDFEEADLAQLIGRVHAERDRLAAAAGIDTPSDLDMREVWDADEDTRSLKSLVLFGIRGMAAYASHARVLGQRDATVDAFFLEALRTVGSDASGDELLAAALKVGEVNLTCMGLLEKANIQTFGSPRPTAVPLAIEPGPFIVVTGHDLLDLKMLLEQTEGTGVAVYTHGEMLPAHGYPELAKYPQLKGNFGTAWQNQRIEFDGIPAPVLFTTNCLMPPQGLLQGPRVHHG
jgi:hydroxylamine reductase